MPGPNVGDNRQGSKPDVTGGRRGKRWPAVAMNVLLPGLGLAYLGKWRFAAANFIVVTLIVAVCFLIPEPTIVEHIHWVFLILLVGSGAVAHALADGSP